MDDSTSLTVDVEVTISLVDSVLEVPVVLLSDSVLVVVMSSELVFAVVESADVDSVVVVESALRVVVVSSALVVLVASSELVADVEDVTSEVVDSVVELKVDVVLLSVVVVVDELHSPIRMAASICTLYSPPLTLLESRKQLPACEGISMDSHNVTV